MPREGETMSIQFLGRVEDSNDELVGGDYGGIPACVIFVELGPGEGPKLHKHPYAEIIFVLEGESTFTDGTESRVVQAGEMVIASADQPHAFINSGGGRLRQIDVHLGPHFDTEWLDA
jgi:mannose-6-phosphate isomerase-like protein (cupin superfamily)